MNCNRRTFPGAAILLGLSVTLACSPATDPAGVAGSCSREELRHLLESELETFRGANPFPGAVAAVHWPGLEPGPVSGAIGLADLEAQRPITTSDRLLAGSVGKTFFAAAALKLSESGALDLDAPIAGYLDDPSLPNASGVTPRMLLSHRSGYPEYDGTFLRGLIEEPLRSRTLDDWTGPVRRDSALGEPGAEFRYSDINFVLLAAVLESAAAEPAYQLIQRLFLAPLGLSDTLPADRPDLPGLVPGYEGERGPFGVDKVTGSDGLIYNPQFEWGGGGFISTAADLASWITALRVGTALSEAAWNDMSTPGPDSDYGLGMHHYETRLGTAHGHSGYIPGYLSWVRWYEAPGLAVAVQTNASDGARIPEDGFDLLDAIARATAESCSQRLRP